MTGGFTHQLGMRSPTPWVSSQLRFVVFKTGTYLQARQRGFAAVGMLSSTPGEAVHSSCI